MDRLAFLESISGIEYPEMIVDFFDQFIALKQLVEDTGKVTVNNKDINFISFNILFNDISNRDTALSNLQTNCIVIYGKPISVQVNTISDTEINIILQ